MPVQAQRVGGVIAPTLSQSGARRKWMVSTMFQQLYYRKRPGTIVQEARNASTLVRMGQKISSHWDLIPQTSSPQQVTVLTTLYHRSCT